MLGTSVPPAVDAVRSMSSAPKPVTSSEKTTVKTIGSTEVGSTWVPAWLIETDGGSSSSSSIVPVPSSSVIVTFDALLSRSVSVSSGSGVMSPLTVTSTVADVAPGANVTIWSTIGS